MAEVHLLAHVIMRYLFVCVTTSYEVQVCSFSSFSAADDDERPALIVSGCLAADVQEVAVPSQC